MSPLFFVDFKYVNQVFCAVMWFVAIGLACAIFAHSAPASAPHHEKQQHMIELPR